jgi:hypothetical protein
VIFFLTLTPIALELALFISLVSPARDILTSGKQVHKLVVTLLVSSLSPVRVHQP